MEEFDVIWRRGDAVVGSYNQRDARIKKLDDVYLLRWPEKPQSPDIKLTMAPDGRNAIRGITNLMTSTSPSFSVPAAENDEQANAYNEETERAIQAMYAASNDLQMVKVEREAAHCLALYDEAYIAISCLTEVAEAITGRGEIGWADRHIIEAAKRSPFLWSAIPPAYAYPLYGRTGLMAFVQKQFMPVSEIAERWGSLASVQTANKKPTDTLEVREYWDNEVHSVKIAGKQVLHAEHGLGFIPVAAALANGTRMYPEPENQRQPLLWTIIQSELWQRKNAILTATFYRLAALGLNATFVHEQGSPDAEIELDFSTMGGVINVPPGGKFRLLTENLLDPNIMNALGLVNNLIEDSTIYRQALGSPVQGMDTFSSLSLLSSAGRLPLVPIQEAAAELLSRSAEIVVKWMKNNSSAKYEAYNKRTRIEIDPAKLPDRISFDVILDVDLPQDMLRNANIAQMLKTARLVDDKWIHENILKIGQTTNMKKRIIAQDVADALAMHTVQKFIQEKTQPPPPPPGAEGQGGQGPGFDAGQGGMPSGMAGQLPMNEKPGGMPGEMGMPMMPGMGGPA